LNYSVLRKKVLRKEGFYSLLFPPLYLLSSLFCLLSFLRGRAYQLGILKRREFRLPVVCVGNLVAGGSGKTSLTEMLYRELEDSGFSPSVVMRGYGGKERGPSVAGFDPERFGDEASVYSLKGMRVIVSRDRVKGIEHAFSKGANLCILDDGFQHLKVKPLVSVLLIDLFNPFGDGKCLPLGTLREPLSSMERADCFVLTRANLVSRERLESVEAYLRSFRKPIFLARQEFDRWVDQDYRSVEKPEGRVNVFCGIGNPDQFVEMILGMGLKVENLILFNDHHSYSEGDIERLSRLDNLVTTEKDMVKLRGSGLKLKVPLLKFEIYGLKEFVINRIRNVERKKELEIEGSLLPDGVSPFKIAGRGANAFKQG